MFMRKGLEASVELLTLGYAPFCPWLDYLFQFISNGNCLNRIDYYEYSLAWLLASDAMIVIELRKHSIGTSHEMKIAENNNIPIFKSIKTFKQWAKKEVNNFK